MRRPYNGRANRSASATIQPIYKSTLRCFCAGRVQRPKGEGMYKVCLYVCNRLVAYIGFGSCRGRVLGLGFTHKNIHCPRGGVFSLCMWLIFNGHSSTYYYLGRTNTQHWCCSSSAIVLVLSISMATHVAHSFRNPTLIEYVRFRRGYSLSYYYYYYYYDWWCGFLSIEQGGLIFA